MKRRFAAAACAAVVLLPAVALAQTADYEVPTIPVQPLADDQEASSFLSELDWRLITNVQYDGLASADAPDARQKDGELRRARLSGLLEWTFDWRLKAGGDFADGAELRDLTIEYRGWPVYVEIGRMVEPFGLLQSSSSNLAFMERPQAAGLAPGYGIGLALNARGDHWGLSFGGFVATRNDETFGARKEEALTIRWTWTPHVDDESLWHVGLGASSRVSEDGFVQFVTIPETVLLTGVNTSSPIMLTDHYNLVGSEFATQVGPVLVQAEYMLAFVESAIGIDFDDPNDFETASPVYPGFYIETIWAVTGERREYSVRRGTFSGVYPDRSIFDGGLGAFELAARYSDTDLTDDELGGERGKVASAAINWYPERRFKLALAGLRIEENASGGIDERYTVVQLRGQVAFALPW